MSIDERLARDIEAVTRGVVVTESDLRDAWAGIDDRIESERPDRRRTLGAAAAAAVIVLVLGVAAFLTLDAEDTAAPPANRGPSPTQSIDNHATFLIGTAPTSENIRGVWRLDNGGVLMRFSPPDLVTWDRKGRLLESPTVHGHYAIEGDTITIDVDGGAASCGGQRIAMRASVPAEGELRFLFTRPGLSACNGAVDERWVMEQVMPASPSMAGLTFSQDKGWAPVAVESRLHGTWLAEGGGHLLELASNGRYHVVGGKGDPLDAGTWSWRGSRLTLTSGPDSTGCSAGDQLVLSKFEVEDPVTPGIRGTVQENGCKAPWTPKTWILIPYDGS
jgi:hypothetical protein